MNIDVTPYNEGAKMTKLHIKTAAKVGHELEGSVFFTEINCGYCYYQVPLHPHTAKSSSFQTHKGIHRLKRLYFRPRASSVIIHNEIVKCLRGIKGVTTIHDNILVQATAIEEHNRNLEACLIRAEEQGYDSS